MLSNHCVLHACLGATLVVRVGNYGSAQIFEEARASVPAQNTFATWVALPRSLRVPHRTVWG